MSDEQQSDIRPTETVQSGEVATPRAKRLLLPLLKYGAVFLFGGGIVAGALASPIVNQAHKIDNQTSAISSANKRIATMTRDLKREKDAVSQCTFAAGFFRQAADEYLVAGQATADSIAHIFGDYSSQLAATGQHASAAKTAYDTAVSLGCAVSGVTVSH